MNGETMKATDTARVIEPNAVYTKTDVALLLDVHERTVQRYDIPWSDLGEHTQRIMGSSLIAWLKGQERAAA